MASLSLGNLPLVAAVAAVVLLCTSEVAVAEGQPSSLVEAETQLLHDLFREDRYSPAVRPADNETDTVQVAFGLSLIAILDLNSATETLETTLMAHKIWHDSRLTWTPSKYRNVDILRVPPDMVWKPDITPYNNAEGIYTLAESMVVIYSTGHILWVPITNLRSTCSVDLTKFPFDEQVCTLRFGSWTYDDKKVNLSLNGDGGHAFALDQYAGGQEWDVVTVAPRVEVRRYKCCPQAYPQYVAELRIRRRPLHYTHVFIVPGILLGLLVPFQLLLPPESKERLTLGPVLIAAILLLELKLEALLPANHTSIPAISVYYTLTLVWITFSLLSSIWVLNVHNRGPRRRKVPESLRWVFLRSLKKLVCLGNDSYYPLDEMETINMRGLDKSIMGVSSPGDSNPRPQGGAPSKLERDVEELSRQVHMLATRSAMTGARQEVLSEWHQVALVMDRVLFFLFMLVFLMSSIILLT